ncbi:MAG: hypothetical protein IKO99_09465 [Bacteroidales bacterium]|nr:hypothetical protein [Bacteroidales bacterium]
MDKITNFSKHFNSVVNKKTRAELRNSIIDITGISYAGFRRWVNSICEVPKIYHTAIAEIMGAEVSELFPNTNNNSEVTIKNAK